MTTLGMAMMVAVGFATVSLLGSQLVRRGFPIPTGARIGQIDGLRGYLALAVMAHHYIIWLGFRHGHGWQAPPTPLFNQLGRSGVALFFMSTGALFYAKIDRGLAGNNWLAIYLGRLFRIVPMLFVSTALCAVIAVFWFGAVPDRALPLAMLKWLTGEQVALMGVAQSSTINARVFWSIQWEWLFYFLIMPLLALFRSMFARRAGWIAFITLIGALLLATQLDKPLFLGEFIIGMLAVEASRDPRLQPLLARRWASGPALVALGCALTLWHGATAAQVLLLGFFFACVCCGNDLLGLLARPGARLLGEISFSIYVLHGIVLFLAFSLTPVDQAPSMVLSLLMAVVVGASSATFLGIERPCIRLGKRLADLPVRWMPATAE